MDSIVMYESVSNELNAMILDWKGQFDQKPDFPFAFSADDHGRLSIDGKELCLCEKVDLDSLAIETESFGFTTIDNISYKVHISWPYEGEAVIDFIEIRSVKFCA